MYLFDFAFQQRQIVAILGRKAQRRLHFRRVLHNLLIQFAALFDEAFLILVRFLECAVQFLISGQTRRWRLHGKREIS